MMSFFNESFCLAICFLIFLYFAYRPIKASIVKALNDRIELIKAQLLEAQSLKNDAELLLNKAEQQLNQLPSIREKMMLEAKASADFLFDKQNQEIEALLEYKKSETINALNNQKLQAYDQLRTELITDVRKLVTAYFKASNNVSLSDIEIAKNLHGKD
ncbi:ATP synthase subunit b precursor [Candidatus Trichorickettsia mobilis]|uniref:ATP synthase subunit b n=1 Tax=Candidatus Trichorickettsia mobilis TaxID=1346319 RepID=A0ABZ0UUL3_9RICK|nr:ATP synthase subunit b precursor [Candidatus Trichorickettsia mobilis]